MATLFQGSSVDGTTQFKGAKGTTIAQRFKTCICRNFAGGFCPYEDRCMFAHGEEELRSIDQNIAEGIVNSEAIMQHRRDRRYNASSAPNAFTTNWSPTAYDAADGSRFPTAVSNNATITTDLSPRQTIQHNPYGMGKHSAFTPEECTCDECERTRAHLRRVEAGAAAAAHRVAYAA